MCNSSCLQFAQASLQRDSILGRRVLEVGARSINGSIRSFVQSHEPSEYVGIDIDNGPGVDAICSGEDIVERFGPEAFDLVITTEMIEHVHDWRRVLSNMKRVLRPGGVLLLTTRSIGFPYHGHPFDFWRFEMEDLRAIFADFDIHTIEKDPEAPGVFFVGHKPWDFRERDLSYLALHAIALGRRKRDLSRTDVLAFRAKLMVRDLLSAILPASVKRALKRYIRVPGVD